jgi:hypothetical protein
MRIFGPHHSHPFIGFDNEFKIGDILPAQPEISGLSIHTLTVLSSGFRVRRLKSTDYYDNLGVQRFFIF